MTFNPEKGSMSGLNNSPIFGNDRRWEILALAAVLLVMVLTWFLTHGLTRAMYDQFASFGDPPAAQGPLGDARRNQLGHLGYFWSERAFHYRTTLMFAVDDFDDPEVLSADTSQQFPDGVNAWREYALQMEPLFGQLYRIFGGRDEILVEFLLRLIPLLHILTILALYLAARGTGAGPAAGVLAVLLYASCSLGFSRFTGSLLLKESLSLLWLMSFLALFLHAVRRRGRLLLGLAGLCLFLLLASWHLGQFLALVVLGSLALGHFLARPAGERPWIEPALTLLLAVVAAGFTPSLWARGFHLSLTMAVVLAWWLATLLSERLLRSGSRNKPGALLFLGLAVLLGAISLFNSQFTGDYNHVFGLLTEKLAHGFQRPADPQDLPFAVRVFWTAPFNTPTWAQISSKLGWQMVPLALGLVLAVCPAPPGCARNGPGDHGPGLHHQLALHRETGSGHAAGAGGSGCPGRWCPGPGA
jgi:hypothetical protein